MVIPKLLHQIWIGPRPAPMAWIETWREINPDFTHHLWTEERIDAFCLRNEGLYRRLQDACLYDGAADVARVEILYRLGGVYADADSIALTPIGETPFMEAGFFAPREPADDREPPPPVADLLSNAFMGSIPEHRVLDRYVDRLSHVRAFRPTWRITGPGALTAILRSTPASDVMQLPPWTFFTTTLTGERVHGGESYARHFWSTTAERWDYEGATPYP